MWCRVVDHSLRSINAERGPLDEKIQRDTVVASEEICGEIDLYKNGTQKRGKRSQRIGESADHVKIIGEKEVWSS